MASGARDAPLVGDGSTPTLEVSEWHIRMVYLTVFLDAIAFSVSTPMMPYYAKSFHVGDAEVGYLFGAWSMMAAIFPPILGRLADKIGRRRVLVISLFGNGCAAMIQGTAKSYWQLLLGRTLSGIWGAVGSTAQVYITDVAPAAIRGRYLTTVVTVPSVAVIFGPGLGGLLSKISYNFPILLDGAVTIFAAIVAFVFLVETPAFLRMRAARAEQEAAAADPSSPASAPSQAVASMPLRGHMIGISTFFFGFMFGTMISMAAVFFQATYGTGSTTIGWCFMGWGALTVLYSFLLVEKTKKAFGVMQTAMGGTVLCGGLLCATAIIPMEIPALAVFILASIGGAMRNTTNAVLVTDMTSASNRGKIVGLVQRYNMCGRCLGPVIMGHVANIREDLPFIIGGLGASLLSVLFLWAASRMPAVAPEEQSNSASMQPQGEGTPSEKPRQSA